MNQYKIDSLDSGGLTLSTHSRVCIDDAAAHATAKKTISTGGIAQVWQGSRNVGTVTVPLPDGPQTALIGGQNDQSNPGV